MKPGHIHPVALAAANAKQGGGAEGLFCWLVVVVWWLFGGCSVLTRWLFSDADALCRLTADWRRVAVSTQRQTTGHWLWYY